MPATGFITGTGFYSLPNIESLEPRMVKTRYGEVEVEIGVMAGLEVVFLPRHGSRHLLSPGQINYRANLMAMKQLGVERILATSVCGSLMREWPPGTLVLIDQFLNFTNGREDTFYPLDGDLAHVDVTDPYCATLHHFLLRAAGVLQLQVHSGATYACFQGPRFESRAEIEMVRRLGGHLVGQTNYPECVLARELAICYASVAVVSNFAAGMGGKLPVRDVLQAVDSVSGPIAALFQAVCLELPSSYECACRRALVDGLMDPVEDGD